MKSDPIDVAGDIRVQLILQNPIQMLKSSFEASNTCIHSDYSHLI